MNLTEKVVYEEAGFVKTAPGNRREFLTARAGSRLPGQEVETGQVPLHRHRGGNTTNTHRVTQT